MGNTNGSMKKILVALPVDMKDRMKRICILENRPSLSDAIREACRQFILERESRLSGATLNADLVAAQIKEYE